MINSWWLPTLLSAVGLGVYDVCKKHAVKDNSVMPVLFLATLCGSGFFVIMSALQGQLLAALQCTAAEFLLVLLLVPMPFLTVVVLLLLVTVCPEDLLMPLPSVCARSP